MQEEVETVILVRGQAKARAAQMVLVGCAFLGLSMSTIGDKTRQFWRYTCNRVRAG